jgi:hypothetical protein
MINVSLVAGPLRIPCCERPVLTSSAGLTLFWTFSGFLLRRWWSCSNWDRPAGRLMCKSLVMTTDLGPRNRRWIKAVGYEINCGETKRVNRLEVDCDWSYLFGISSNGIAVKQLVAGSCCSIRFYRFLVKFISSGSTGLQIQILEGSSNCRQCLQRAIPLSVGADAAL